MGNLSGLDFSKLDKPPEQQIREAMQSTGITPPQSIQIDGQIHRFATAEHGQDDAGWYVFFSDPITAGAFGDWRTGSENQFRALSSREYSPVDEMRIKAQIQKAKDAKLERQDNAAKTVREIWDNAPQAPDDHPYLMAKTIQPGIAKISGDGRIMFPLWDFEGELRSIQFVDNSGDKLFFPGGQTKGCCHVFGDLDAKKMYLAEGYATASTIHGITGCTTIAVYSAGNLSSVAEQARARNPGAELVIVADNDSLKQNTGLIEATKAAELVGATVIEIPEPGMDANDYHRAGHDLQALLCPAVEQSWLVNALDWASKPDPIKWIIKGVLQESALVMAHGPSGCGKTFAVLDWLLSIGSGAQTWNGRKINPCPVAYLAGEGHNGLKARIAAWMQIKRLSPAQFWLSKSAMDLNKPEVLPQVIKFIRGLPEAPKVIAVDTLHRFMDGDENSAQDSKTMIDACGILQREFGACVILIHHTGVSEEAQKRARGSSAWKGALDLEYSIRPEGDGLMIEQMKAKDSELIEPIYASLESVSIDGWFDEDGEPVTSAVLEIGERKKRPPEESKDIKIIKDAWFDTGTEMLDGCPYVSRSALIQFLVSRHNKTESTARQEVKVSSKRFIGRLIDEGIIQESGSGFIVTDQDQKSMFLISKGDGNTW